MAWYVRLEICKGEYAPHEVSSGDSRFNSGFPHLEESEFDCLTELSLKDIPAPRTTKTSSSMTLPGCSETRISTLGPRSSISSHNVSNIAT